MICVQTSNFAISTRRLFRAEWPALADFRLQLLQSFPSSVLLTLIHNHKNCSKLFVTKSISICVKKNDKND